MPQGGNTGLVGGATPYGEGHPDHAKVILSLARMNQIFSIDQTSGIVRAQAGCILEKVDEECRNRANLMMPIDLGAKGSCQIGGILATNAGGIRFLRYGSLHGSILGLEVVLADGRILREMRGLHKDNTGYDLKQLFIGSEGTLGIITEAAIAAVPKLNSINVACFKLCSFEAVRNLFIRTRESLGEILSAFEFWDSQTQSALNEHHPAMFEGATDGFYVLIETSGSDAQHDTEKLTRFLENIMNDGLVEDGILAQDQRQQAELWARREGIPETSSKQQSLKTKSYGQVHKFDLSLPLDKYYRIVELLREKCPEGIKVFGFGHVGDGNLHINLVDCVDTDAKIMHEIGDFIFDWTSKNGGSVSAEHGIGQAKRDYLHLSKDSTSIEVMRSLKSLLDPNSILNPGKVI